jgi:hypothetical protein
MQFPSTTLSGAVSFQYNRYWLCWELGKSPKVQECEANRGYLEVDSFVYISTWFSYYLSYEAGSYIIT